MLSTLKFLYKSAFKFQLLRSSSTAFGSHAMKNRSCPQFTRSIFSYDGFNFNQGGNSNGPVDTEFYDTLQVSPTASQDEIKKAFRTLAMKHHPDKGGDPETFKKIKEAYDILGNADKRAMYDRVGKSVTDQPDNGPHMSDIDLESILSQIFGMGGMNNGFAQQNETEDMIQTIDVDLSELYTGCTKHYRMRRDRICTTCKGTGSKSGKLQSCSSCHGTGYVSRVINMGGFITRSQSVCPQCGGQGNVVPHADICTECKGKKIKKEMEELDVVIDPGRKNGDKIIFSHKSNEYPGAITGDVIFIIQEHPHKEFKRSGMDLLMKKKISLESALCGCSIPIHHINGDEFILKSTAEDIIQPYGVRVADNLGMPVYKDSKRFGNLYIQFEINMPKNLSIKQKDALRLILGNKEFNIIDVEKQKQAKEEEEKKKKQAKEEEEKKNINTTHHSVNQNQDTITSEETVLNTTTTTTTTDSNTTTTENVPKNDSKQSLKEKILKKTVCKSKFGEKLFKECEKVETDLHKEKEKIKNDIHSKMENTTKNVDTDANKNQEIKKETFTECILRNCDQQIYGNRALWDNIWSPNRRTY